MTTRDRNPICEECDEEMNRYGPALDTGKMGWRCDSCGWSWDDDENEEEPMTHTPTKNSETLNVRNCQRCGKDHDGLAVMPLQNPADQYTHWSECPTVLQPILISYTRAPERGEGEEAGIDRFNPTLTKQGGIVPVAAMKQSANGRFVRYEDHVAALSRQTAVGGDWEKELEDLLIRINEESNVHTNDLEDIHNLFDRALRCATHTPERGDWEKELEGAITSARRESLEPQNGESYKGHIDRVLRTAHEHVRRALRATRTPEGEITADTIKRALLDSGEFYENSTGEVYHGARYDPIRVGNLVESFRSIFIPPPRPTATGGITVEKLHALFEECENVCVSDRADGWIPDGQALDAIGDLRSALTALIERAGEEGK